MIIWETVLDGYIYDLNQNSVICLIEMKTGLFIKKLYPLEFFIDNKVIPIIGIGFEIFYYDNLLRIRSAASDQLRL